MADAITHNHFEVETGKYVTVIEVDSNGTVGAPCIYPHGAATEDWPKGYPKDILPAPKKDTTPEGRHITKAEFDEAIGKVVDAVKAEATKVANEVGASVARTTAEKVAKDELKKAS